MWIGRTDVGFTERLMGFYERAQKILAGANHYCPALDGDSGGVCTGFSCSTVYLYIILNM